MNSIMILDGVKCEELSHRWLGMSELSILSRVIVAADVLASWNGDLYLGHLTPLGPVELRGIGNLGQLCIRAILGEIIENNSTLGLVVAWCHQAPSHYQTQCWIIFNNFPNDFSPLIFSGDIGVTNDKLAVKISSLGTMEQNQKSLFTLGLLWPII